MSATRPKILVFPFNLMAHYLRTLEFVKRYKEFDIYFQSSDAYNSSVLSENHHLFHAVNFDEKFVLKEFERFNFQWLNKTDLTNIIASQIEIINEYQPKFVIGDTNPCLKIACEVTQTKYISVTNGYMTPYYDGVRDLPSGYFISRLVNYFPKNLKKLFTNIGEKIVFYYIHTPFKQIRKKYNLTPLKSYLDELVGDENYICDEEFLFPQKKLPKNYSFIGSLLLTNNHKESALIAKLNKSKKNICISTGSSGKIEDFTFLNDPFFLDYKIIITGKTSETPENEIIITQTFVNLDEVLPYCSLLICHGGNGTIYYGLKHKVPMYCIPKHLEQEWNAKRIEDLKLGYFHSSRSHSLDIERLKKLINFDSSKR